MVSFSAEVEETTVTAAPEKVVVLVIEKGRGLVSGRPRKVQEKAG